jgi:hypothetical protein
MGNARRRSMVIAINCKNQDLKMRMKCQKMMNPQNHCIIIDDMADALKRRI